VDSDDLRHYPPLIVSFRLQASGLVLMPCLRL
jgi:hypothetical protein